MKPLILLSFLLQNPKPKSQKKEKEKTLPATSPTQMLVSTESSVITQT